MGKLNNEEGNIFFQILIKGKITHPNSTIVGLIFLAFIYPTRGYLSNFFDMSQIKSGSTWSEPG